MAQKFEIKRYVITLFSSEEKGVITIELYDQNDIVARVMCSDKWDPLPQSTTTSPFGDGTRLLFYHYKDAQIILDVLRNESPVYVQWGEEQVSYFTTSQEPVGETEGIQKRMMAISQIDKKVKTGIKKSK